VKALFEKLVLKRLIRELQANIDGMKKMSKDYESNGGFKEITELVDKFNAGEFIPRELLSKGRQAELKFAEACAELAEYYQQLLNHVKKQVEKA
jgi:hypothetical protein